MPEQNTRDSLLEARLSRLEKTCQELSRERSRWRRRSWCAVAAGCVLALTGAAAAIPAVLESENFVLRDKEGRMRAALAIRPDGTPGLGFFDETGQTRLSMSLTPRGTPGVDLMDEKGRPQMALAVRPDGTPGVGLFDREGQVRVSLDAPGVVGGGVHLYGETGFLRAALAVRPDGTPGLGLFDAMGQPLAGEECPQAPPATNNLARLPLQ
jgi:hypothetical protein